MVIAIMIVIILTQYLKKEQITITIILIDNDQCFYVQLWQAI